MWSRYRKYLELRDNWHIQEGTREEGDALSSYYSDFYHRWWMDGAQIFGRISGISATLGVQSIRHVSGESASAGIQTRSRSGENALNELVLRTRYVTRRGTVLSSMSKLRASLAVTHSSARKKISIWSAKVTLQFLVWGWTLFTVHWTSTLQSCRWRRQQGVHVQEGDEVEQCCSGVSGLIFNILFSTRICWLQRITLFRHVLSQEPDLLCSA